MTKYEQFVLDLFKPGSTNEQLTHAALGVAGEAGEIVDIIKKMVFYERPDLDKKLREEIGDVMFYITAVCNVKGWSLEDLIEENISKLSVRFPSGTFIAADAIARRDKT